VLKPAAVIIENVPAVMLDRSRVVDKAKHHLERGGYHVCDATVQLLKFGVPQTRKRHLLVATRKRAFQFDAILERLQTRDKTAGQFLQGLEDEPDRQSEPFYQPSRMTAENRKRVTHLFRNKLYDLPDHLRPSCHRDKEHSYISMYGRMYWEKPAQTITSGFGSMGQGRFVHPTRPRTITPHEAARLQGFPDFFDFSSVSGVTALREMIGNAVPPQLTAVLVSHLIENGYL
jgi:DNA (cytosine-5)-methyltransferase 1